MTVVAIAYFIVSSLLMVLGGRRRSMSERRETGYFSVILFYPRVLAFGF